MKHHFVPHFLLRRWRDADGKVRVFEIKNGRLVSARRAPEYTGYEEDLYAVDGRSLGVDTHHFEDTLFVPIDNNAALVLKKIEAREELSEEEHHAWTTFLASFRVRIPDTIDYLRNEHVARLRAKLAERDKTTLPEDWPRTEEWAAKNLPGLIENVGLTFLKQMIEHPLVMQTFGTLKWWCYRFGAGDPPLLLADMPLHWEGKPADPEFWIVIPTAPDLAFFGTRAETTEDQLANLGSAELARRINVASVASAVRRIWARDEEPAHSFITEHMHSMGVNTSKLATLLANLDEESAAPDASRSPT